MTEPFAQYRPVDHATSIAANRRWWDAESRSYQAEHRDQLGVAEFVWGPEGLAEANARLLTADGVYLELGGGAGQCSRWLTTQGRQVVNLDLSLGQLRCGQELDVTSGVHVPHANAEASRIPLADGSCAAVFCSYGALQFVADIDAVFADVHRVLQHGGQWVFSVTHPIRWAFLDDPGPDGLSAVRSYFDTEPYAEIDDQGHVCYVEHHRTVAQWVNTAVAQGFRITSLTEPTWDNPDRPDWGGWSKLRGKHLPGTLIVACVRN